MKVGQIISLVEKYYTLKTQLQRDVLDYQEFSVFDGDDIKAEQMKKKIQYDKEVLGKFLDMEV